MSNHAAHRWRGRAEHLLDQTRTRRATRPSGTQRRRAKAIDRRHWVCLLTHRPRGYAEPGCGECEAFAARILDAGRSR